ncbi:hypothetical protein N5915_05390 [Arcobacter lacus]|uniref:Calx-beta domain-containing protein n=1 Tax=Arcobacter lacus TaxID=1912876 RepID=UPI0021BB8A33|nr:Calx-beta domain-containing protein [Arcobacter lacus]MCT7908986.1 hypothetical protein [Arcobacter lacus]
MSQVGIIKTLSSGKFYLKDNSGNIKELNIGDTISENQIVYGDSSNSTSAKVEILLSSNDVIVLSNGQKQLIDSSLVKTAFGNEELFFTKENLDSTFDNHNSNSNIISDLRNAEFGADVEKILEESANGENQATGDVTEQETTEGKEEVEDQEEGNAEFQARDANETDVNSDLREAKFPRTQSYREVEKNEEILEQGLKDLGSNISNNYFNSTSPSIIRPESGGIKDIIIPINPIIPSNSYTPIPVQVVNPANLSVNDVKIYEQSGNLYFTVTIDKLLSSDITFTYKTSPLTATNEKDYKDVIGTITIPAGTTTVQIPVPIKDDFLYENSENFKITISNPIGNVNIIKAEGIGTILDNPPVNNNPLNPNKPDSETGTYGEEDTVFVVIIGDKTVNEGDKAHYTVQIIDKDGNPVFVTKDTKVTVVYKNISTSNDDTEYKDGEYIKKDIIIKAGASKSEIFDVETNDDYLADNGEKFKLKITQVETTNEFENIVIGDKNGNQKDITTTILDDSKPTNYNPENSDNSTPSYPDPNKPNDGKIEKNQEQVILKIVAVDETGNPIMDGNKYTFVNSVNEGSNAKYMVLAFEPNTTEFTTQTVLSPLFQAGTVTIKTADDTALTTGTKDDAKLDYESTQKTVTLGQVFEVKTLDDYISDNDEKYKVSIIDSSYIHPRTPIYENVKTDPNPVITTIYDNSNPNNGIPHNPNDLTNHNQESDKEIVLIKLFAADKYGNVIKDGNGNYVLANRFAEGTEAKYIAFAFEKSTTSFNDSTKLNNQNGIVDISFTNGTATGSLTGNDIDTTGNKDFNNTSKSNISLGVSFGTNVFKDNLVENEENYTVKIIPNTYKGYYESVEIDTNPVTTTIYDKVDTIYAVIEGDMTVNEGDKATYTIKFVDKNGNEIEVDADTKVKVKFNHNNTNSTQNEDTQYNNDDELEITIKAGKSTSEPFTVQTNDDVYKDDGEKYKLTIINIENTHGYNTSNIGDKDGNKKDIVTEIKDNTNSGTETDIDPVKIILVALEKGQTLADITDTDGKLIYKNTNTTPESGELSYIAVAVDSENKILTQNGQVTVNTVDIIGGAKGSSSTTPKINGSEDYKSLVNQSVNIGEVFKVKTNDDYVRDNNEAFIVKITNIVNTNYESPSIDTTKDTVTSTITDNPAQDTENPKIPIEPTDLNDTTKKYGEEDTVYVKITQAPSTIEGGNLVHTITLVDKNGDPVTVPAGQTVTVNLTYSANSGDFTESDLSTIIKSVTITGGNSSVNFTNITKDDFTYEGDEVYNVTISSVTQSGAFENVVIGDKDGNYKSTTGTIKDGVTLIDSNGNKIVPENAIVDEDRFDVTNDASTIKNTDSNTSKPAGTLDHQGEYLNIIKPNTDDGYSLVFDNTIKVYQGDATSIIDYGLSNLKSGGQDIHYQIVGNKIIGYIGTDVGNSGTVAAADKVFEITLNKNSDILSGTTTKDSYTYTQYKNIDHPVKGDATVSTNDDNITFEFGFKVSDQGQTSDIVKFKVTVNDSLPKTAGWTEEVNEDESKIIVISPESFAGGYIEIANGTMNGSEPIYYKLGKTVSGDIVTKVDIYDPNDLSKKIGELTTSGNGTVLFTPSTDYSNYDYTNNPSFSYKVSDFDGDTAGAKVEIKIKPVADAPTITFDTTKGAMNGTTFEVTTKEDNENNNEGSHKVDLGLKVPALSKDQTDLDTGKGDNPERNGEITLTFINGNSVTGAKIFKSDGTTQVGADITTANQTLKIVIVTVSGDSSTIDYTYHHKDITASNPSGAIYLTQAEYESLKIQHAEDNDTDIKIGISVTSYELDDNGKPLSTATYGTQVEKETTANMTVKINPITDDIKLEFDGNAIPGTISSTNSTNDTFTFTNKIIEGSGEIILNNILSNTSGGIGATPDLDGSEKRTYTIEGLPEGTIVKIGNTEAIAGSDGKATLTFKDAENKLLDPQFTIQFPEHFGGGVKATITLSVYDKGMDSTDTKGATISKTVYLNLDVEPVVTTPDINTIQVSQAIGYEDAGRSQGNSATPNSTINQAQNGIPLNIKVSSTDTDGSEKANIKIGDIPNGSALYVFDNSLNSGAGAWVLVDKDFISSGNISVTQSAGKYTVEIKDYQNDKSPKFIPAFNEDSDPTLKVQVQFIDTVIYNDGTTKTETSTWSATKDIDVIVKNVADAPIGTELKANISVDEDSELNLQSIYTTPANLKSTDATEDLTVKIELQTGFTIVSGSPYYIEDGLYVVKASDIASGNIKIVPPKDFSGNASFYLTYVTTEKAGENDSKTWQTQTVNIFVEPQADDVNVNSSTTMYEDVSTKVDLVATLKDSGTTYGTETINNVYILKTTIDDMISKGYKLSVNGVDIVTKTSQNITGIENGVDGEYYVLTNAEADQITVINTIENKIDSNFTLNVAYKVTDTNGLSSDTKIYAHTHEVIVKAVTDQPTLTLGNITTTSGTDVEINGTNVTVKADSNTDFTIPINTTSNDNDSSETVQKIVITGVPMGVSVEGATYYGYSGSEHNGIWVILNPIDNLLDSNGTLQNIKFIINPGADFENRTVSITTYTKDSGDANVESDTKTINIIKDYDTPSGLQGNPPLFNLSTKPAIIYEDNNDGTQDVIYNLGKSINVTNSGGGTSGYWAITITDFTEGTKVSGYDYFYEEAGKIYYVITGTTTTGNAADIETRLSNVIVTPPENKNSEQIGNLKSDMTFSATISTSDNGTFKTGQGITNYSNSITAVTDEMTVNINVSNTNEDTPTNLTIRLTNPNDATKTTLIGNSIIIKVTETWADIATGGVGEKGTLTDSSGKYNIVDNGNGTYTITPKSGIPAFTVDTDITGLVYTPASNRDGDVKFEVSVQNKEGNSITLTSKGEITISIIPIVDMKPNVTVVTATSIEDSEITNGSTTLKNSVKLEVTTSVSPDSSEKFTNIVLDEVPNGFTVWYIDDSNNLVMATNIGQSGITTFDLTPNIDTDDEVHRNKWLIPASSDGTMPEIYINAPENWSGDFDFKAQFTLKEQNLNTTEKTVVNVIGHIDSIADGVTIDPTLTFGKAFSWIDLKLNANMQDVDGSETMSLKLTGLSENAQFRFSDGTVLSDATWDSTTNKWTINGITFDQINNIQFTNDKNVSNVSVEAWTQEIDKNGNPIDGIISTSDTKTFNVDIKDVGGVLSLEEKVNLDFTKLSTESLKGINIIDLSITGENKLENLSLQDVLNITNNSGELTIKGLSEDKVSFKNDGLNTWTKSGTDAGFDIYTNSGNSDIKVKVEQAISDGITN